MSKIEMMQSRKYSFIGVMTNYKTGYIKSVLIQLLVYPLFDIHVSLIDKFWLAAIFLRLDYFS